MITQHVCHITFENSVDLVSFLSIMLVILYSSLLRLSTESSLLNTDNVPSSTNFINVPLCSSQNLDPYFGEFKQPINNKY